MDLAGYATNGCAVVPGLLTPAEVDGLRAEALRICRGGLGPVDGLVPPTPGDTDDDVIRRYLCVHYPHELSPVMAAAMALPSIVDVLVRVIGGVVFFNGYLLHRSLPNTGRRGLRRALVNHYMSATSRLPWWARPTASPSPSGTTATSSWSPAPTRTPTSA
ncbi:hypothetical protein GCM10009557_65850 [Virgisporangium ochraceum]|uniref:Phytanoyl-CoA dioxygenase family protein n=1 Tax=Virgisporangium ochraceum TaxID=65505 RepID=A0A8J3ZWF1_9ACTN|nr:hypothetical protein [Virgisporangium ochraceum]GIJ70443.1 hypothetical protein Voc01_053600 [Virgisporangium ochraceum]